LVKSITRKMSKGEKAVLIKIFRTYAEKVPNKSFSPALPEKS
jgi:hypothetical protein